MGLMNLINEIIMILLIFPNLVQSMSISDGIGFQSIFIAPIILCQCIHPPNTIEKQFSNISSNLISFQILLKCYGKRH